MDGNNKIMSDYIFVIVSYHRYNYMVDRKHDLIQSFPPDNMVTKYQIR